jgi:hypothetical protein
VDDRLALRHGDAEVGLGEGAADAQDHVRLVEELAHRLRIGAASRAQRQRMGLVEAALALEAGADRDREQLGEFLELGIGLGPVHALTGIDHRALGRHQHLGGLGDLVRSGTVLGDDDRLVIQRIGRVLGIGVGRQLDDHRRAAAVAQHVEGAAHDVDDFLAVGDRLGVLGDVRHGQRRVEVGRHVGDAARVALRDHQQRHRFAVGLGDAAVGVLRARAALHAEHAHLAALGQPRHGVGHVQADALLADDDRADVDRGAGLDQMVDRIGEEVFDAFLLENVGDRWPGLHLVLPCGPARGPGGPGAGDYLFSSFIALSRPPRVNGNMRLLVSCCSSWIDGV